MKNTLAIFFDKNQSLDTEIEDYIKKSYKDSFYITDSISIRDAFDRAILHYTDVRMRNIDILITNILDVYKIKDLHNKIIFYFDGNKSIVPIDNKEYEYLLQIIDCIIYSSNSTNFQIIKDVLCFTKETIDVSEYV